MSVDSKINEIESARDTIRSKMVAAGQASSSDKLSDLANNLTFDKYYSIDDSTESTIANDDYIPFYDTSATAKKKSTWSNIKSKLKAYFDTLYPSVGGHTIEDSEGTALTQRDTLQFGGDLEVSDDDENEKTVVAPHELTAAELTEIMSTLPGQPTQGITIDLRGNERVVGKVIESDGTEKTLYQKTVSADTIVGDVDKDVGLIDANIDRIYFMVGVIKYTTGVQSFLNRYLNQQQDAYVSEGHLYFTNQVYAGKMVVTLQYTKTTS